jgi:hypothetical protein
MRERLIADVPMEAVGVWLSHNTGFDMSTLPPRFSVRELNERIIAANASPVGFVGLLIEQYGQDGEITRDEFMRYGLLAATGYATTQAGTAGLCQLSRLLSDDVSAILPRAQAVSRMPRAIAALRMCCQRRVAAETCWRMRDRQRRKFRSSSWPRQ